MVLLAEQLNMVMVLLAEHLKMVMVLLASAEYGHSVTCCTAEHASCYLLHG
jgi:hypothetical protein